jgi:hypothetical protein
MGNDLTAYRAAIGSHQPLTKKKTMKGKHMYEGEFIILGSLILFMETWENMTYFLIICIYILAMCCDIHPNPGPNNDRQQKPANLRFCNLNIHSVKTKGRFEQVKKACT